MSSVNFGGEVCRTTNHFQSTSHSHVRVFFFSVRKVPKIWWCIHSLVVKFNILPTKNSREISKKERDHLSLLEVFKRQLFQKKMKNC